jgi:hypothetical protein
MTNLSEVSIRQQAFQVPINTGPLSKADFSERTARSFAVEYPRVAGLFIFLLDNPRIWTQENRSFSRKTPDTIPSFQALIRVYLRSD